MRASPKLPVVTLTLAALLVGLGPASGEDAEPCFAEPVPIATPTVDGALTISRAIGPPIRLADLVVPDAIDAAKAAIDAFLTEGDGDLIFAALRDATPDRYGRVPGDVVRAATGASLRDALVRDGLALVDPLAMSDACLAESFALEREAEARRHGFWALPDSVLDAAALDVEEAAGRYRLVAGELLDIGETRRTIYLNFGETYRTDFTALVDKRDARDWRDGGAADWADEVGKLSGTNVRVRGVLEPWQGGMIRVEHPAQIERIGAQRSR